MSNESEFFVGYFPMPAGLRRVLRRVLLVVEQVADRQTNIAETRPPLATVLTVLLRRLRDRRWRDQVQDRVMHDLLVAGNDVDAGDDLIGRRRLRGHQEAAVVVSAAVGALRRVGRRQLQRDRA